MSGESRSSERKILAAEKQRQALMLRKAGATYEMIQEKLGYASVTGAYKAVMTALKNTIKEPAEEVRQMELQRLDMAQIAIAEHVRKGDVKAIDRWLRIIESRCKLLGLYPDNGMKVQATIQSELVSQFNLLFETLASDAEIPNEVKQRIFATAAQLQERSLVSAGN